MWMTLLYVIAAAAVVIIVAVALFYAVVFLAASAAVVFGSRLAWKKRTVISGLIPDESFSAESMATQIVRGGVTGAIEAVKKSRAPADVIEATSDPQKSIETPRRIEKKRQRSPAEKPNDKKRK